MTDADGQFEIGKLTPPEAFEQFLLTSQMITH
jgi:hypothetical protein